VSARSPTLASEVAQCFVSGTVLRAVANCWSENWSVEFVFDLVRTFCFTCTA
jgi:hypothetical protein